MTEQELMLTSILDCDRSELYVQTLELTAAQKQTFDQMQKRRGDNEPLQYILGQTHFFGYPFKVDPRVLVPRPETELLVESVLDFVLRHYGNQVQILDVGSGSGNIAVALAKSLPAARVTSLDISPDALVVARENARKNAVANQIDFVHCDFFEFVENYTQAHKRFDIIVSNPPYISTAFLALLPEDVKKEPVLALDGGDDGLRFYQSLIGGAKHFLKDNGLLACEIGDGQKERVSSMLVENGFVDFSFKSDYRDTPRYFLARVQREK